MGDHSRRWSHFSKSGEVLNQSYDLVVAKVIEARAVVKTTQAD